MCVDVNIFKKTSALMVDSALGVCKYVDGNKAIYCGSGSVWGVNILSKTSALLVDSALGVCKYVDAKRAYGCMGV